MDDYYDLLGIESDAPRDEIRAAYRDRKAALDASTDAGKAEAAQLNKAWNVLSDPYQRGRYDERLAQGGDLDEDEDVLTEVRSNGRGKTSSSRPVREPRAKRPLPPPTITPPAGTRFPKTKQRVLAMVFDLVVLLVFYVGFAFIGHAVADSQHPGTFKQIDNLTTQVSDDQKTIDSANKDLDTAKKNNAPDVAAKQKAVDDAKAKQKADQKELDHLNGVVGPIQNLFVGFSFILAAIYLIVPSIFTGRTLGKRLQHLKVLRDDGSKVSAWDVTKRYGAIVLVTYAGTVVLGPLLGPLVPVIVLFGVLQWMRNSNMQGMHDRIAHTMVVTDASE